MSVSYPMHQKTVSVKDEVVNILDFAGHMSLSQVFNPAIAV